MLAQEPTRALAASLEAARAAEDVHALAESSRCYDAALELWDAVDPAARPVGSDLSTILERAAVCRSLGFGDASGSVRLLERALAELPDDAPPLRRADLLSRLADATWDATAEAESIALWAHVGGFAAGLALVPIFKRREQPLFAAGRPK